MSELVDLAQRVVALAKKAGADEAQATAGSGEYFEIDFSTCRANLARSAENLKIDLTLFRGGKRGAASVNSSRAEALDEAVAGALAAAEAGIADEANVVAEAESVPYQGHGVEKPDRAAMVAGVEVFGATLVKEYPEIVGRSVICAFNNGAAGFANSRGLVQASRRGAYSFFLMFAAREAGKTTSINYTGASAYTPFADLLAAGGLRRLLDESVASLHARPAPAKFVGDVIFTPESADALVGPLAGALSGYGLFAGTSPFADSQGQAIASPCFSLLNRPRGENFPGGADFDSFGVPTRDLDVIRDGVLDAFLVDFFMSRKLGRAETAGAQNFVVPSGEKPLAEIIGGVKRGILLSRLSGGAPNAALDFSGVAKNSFYIEDGEIRHALSETMISGNFRELLRGIFAVSRESVDFGDRRYPFIAASGALISPAP
jgi:PmbA protein